MLKRPKKAQLPNDINQLARMLVDMTTQPQEAPLPPKPKAPKGLKDYMRKIGARGGTVSGQRRMTNLSDEQRREIASTAARARWLKAKAAKDTKKR